MSFYIMTSISFDYLNFPIEQKPGIQTVHFNTSCCNINDEIIYVTRCINIPLNGCNEAVVGNNSSTWFWNGWQFFKNTFKFFVKRDGKFIELLVEDTVLASSLADVRIFSQNNTAFIYDGHGQSVYECDFTSMNTVVLTKRGLSRCKRRNMASIKFYDCTPGATKELKKAHLMSYPGEFKTQLTFFDWFYEEGLRAIISTSKNDKISSLEELKDISIPYGENYPLDGTGSCIKIKQDFLMPPDDQIKEFCSSFERKSRELVSEEILSSFKRKFGKNSGIMPLFSLGVPCIQVVLKDGSTAFLTVGHSKIPTGLQCQYLPDSNIDKMRNKIYKLFPEIYEEYRPHFGSDGIGYHYFLYFLLIKTDCSKFWISDSFLPVDLDEKQKYGFSLCFPMGLAQLKESLMITYGEGDCYTGQLNISLVDALDLCKHENFHLDMEKYEYHLLIKKNGIVSID